MRRAVSLTLGLALLLTACGPVSSPGAGPIPTEPGPVATTGPTLTTVVTPPVTTTVAPTTTTPPPPGTTSSTPTSTTSTVATPTATTPPADVVVVPYFYLDEAGHPSRTGPFLAPMTREVPATKAVARASMEQLLAGPSREEGDSVPAISTAIPDGVRLLGLTVSDGIATVDLSSAFEATDAAAVSARVAQVVFTLSRYPSVQEVLFRQEGVDVAVPTGSGQLVSRPVNIGDYLELAAALHVEQPSYRGQGANPLQVMGFGAVFEASFQYALIDDDGLIIAEGQAMTTNGTGWGGFDFSIDYEVDREQVGALIVWAHSAQDGAQIDVREYPVTLVP